MFERYTEKARRAIFFSRYEASQFGCPQIEAEFLLLGLFREDRALANQFLASFTRLEDLRQSITQHIQAGPKIAASLDLPLSHECKRALAYAAEESELMNHKLLGTVHLLLGLLREEKSFAAQLLREQGLTVILVREQVLQSEPSRRQGRSVSIAGLDQWLADRESPGSVWTVSRKRVGSNTSHFALYAADIQRQSQKDEDMAPDEQLAQIRMRIELVVVEMERAIANYEFDKARFYSGEERKERENLRRLCEQFNLEAPPPRTPRLCIEIIGDDLFSEVGKRCEDYIAEGVVEVWLLDPGLKRAYTVTRVDGLREFKGETLLIVNPSLAMDLRNIFV